MNILPATDDFFHDIDIPGGYEWSYFDGLSDDGQWGYVAIFFRGIPMSPNYTQAIDRWTRTGKNPPEPRDYCAFNFNLYHRGRRIYSVLHERPRERFEAGRRTADVRIGANAVHASVAPDGTRSYLMQLDTSLGLQHRKLVGDITITARTGDLSTLVTHTKVDSTSGAHYWVPAALDGEFRAQLDLWRLGRGVERIRFTGRGYHDRNLGTEPLHHLPGNWRWGRLHDGEHTFVYFHLDGYPESEEGFCRELLLRRGELVSEREGDGARGRGGECEVDRSVGGPAARAGLASQDRGGGIRVESKDVLDWGPFYHRYLMQLRVEREGWPLLAGPAITEHLRPHRLGVAFFRPFVRFRVRRLKK